MPSYAYVIEVDGREVWRLFDLASANRFAEGFCGATVRSVALSAAPGEAGE